MSATIRKEAYRRKSVRFGTVAVLLFGVLVAFAVTAKNGLPAYLPFVERSTVTATFEDVGALRAGDEVRIADVRAGFVKDIELVDGLPVVTMELEGEPEVFKDATAVIAARSGLGQKYVLLHPGTSEAGRLGDTTLAADQTVSPTELDDVLDALDEPTREGAQTTLLQVGGGAVGQEGNLSDGLAALPSILPNLSIVAKALTVNGGDDLANLLETTDLLAGSLEAQQAELEQTVRGLDTTLAALTTDGAEPLTQTITQAPEVLADLTPVLDDLNGPLADLHVAVETLQPGAEALGASVPDLRGVMTEAVAPLGKVSDVSPSATTAVESLTPTMIQLQPLTVQTATTFARASQPLEVLAPYSEEVLLFFQNAASALGQRDAAGGWLRFYPVIQPESLLGALPIADPFVSRQAYPAPGEAATHRESSILGDGRQ